MSVATYDRDLIDGCWSVRRDSQANLALLPIGIVAHLYLEYVLLTYVLLASRSSLITFGSGYTTKKPGELDADIATQIHIVTDLSPFSQTPLHYKRAILSEGRFQGHSDLPQWPTLFINSNSAFSQ